MLIGICCYTVKILFVEHKTKKWHVTFRLPPNIFHVFNMDVYPCVRWFLKLVFFHFSNKVNTSSVGAMCPDPHPHTFYLTYPQCSYIILMKPFSRMIEDKFWSSGSIIIMMNYTMISGSDDNFGGFFKDSIQLEISRRILFSLNQIILNSDNAMWSWNKNFSNSETVCQKFSDNVNALTLPAHCVATQS